jgi:hypothetical protein
VKKRLLLSVLLAVVSAGLAYFAGRVQERAELVPILVDQVHTIQLLVRSSCEIEQGPVVVQPPDIEAH